MTDKLWGTMTPFLEGYDKATFGLSAMGNAGLAFHDWTGSIFNPTMDSVKGPKFKAESPQTSTYGEPIPRIYGRVVTSGNLFWLEDNKLRVVSRNVQPESADGGS